MSQLFLRIFQSNVSGPMLTRVNCRIKRILIETDNNQIIDMEDEAVKYCISAVSCMVSSYGLRQLVSY